MRILMLSQVLPYPPDSGPKIKTWNTLRYLAARHAVTLVAFTRGDEAAGVTALRQVCAAVHSVPIRRTPDWEIRALAVSLATGRPWLMARDDRPAMRQLIDRLAREGEFDAVHAEQLNMAQYALRVPARRVLDNHNALWLLYRRLWETLRPGPKRWLFGRDWRRLKAYEGDMLRRFDAAVAVSESDRSALREATGTDCRIDVIPIGVDVDALAPVQRAPDARRLVHIGTMYWPPNVDGVLWFLREVWPLVRARRPDAQFDVVGARPPRALLAAAQEAGGVNVTGYVADTGPILRAAGAVVVPLRAGGGMRVKILEALARELPVITTTIGCEGIAVTGGRHALIADAPEDFAAAVLRLLGDRELAAELGRNGRQLVAERYEYRVACRGLDAIYSNGLDEVEEHAQTSLARV